MHVSCSNVTHIIQYATELLCAYHCKNCNIPAWDHHIFCPHFFRIFSHSTKTCSLTQKQVREISSVFLAVIVSLPLLHFCILLSQPFVLFFMVVVTSMELLVVVHIQHQSVRRGEVIIIIIIS